jgi:hypothetical protein
MIQVENAPAAALAGVWDAAVLGPVREINEQVVDILCEAAAAGAGCAELLAVVRGEFLPAPAAARRRLAGCPYLLLDAGFGERARWVRPAGVQDAAQAVCTAPPVVDCGVGLARRALVLGWHLARSNRLAARVALGMTPACADLVGALRLKELEALAEVDCGCVRLRWENRPELWRPLLRAALAEHPAVLAGLQMRGLQLMAADSGLSDS